MKITLEFTFESPGSEGSRGDSLRLNGAIESITKKLGEDIKFATELDVRGLTLVKAQFLDNFNRVTQGFEATIRYVAPAEPVIKPNLQRA